MINYWNNTDLTFEYCIKLFVQIEAAKREKIPPETARQWFIEFLRRGWNRKILSDRYKALMATKIYGIEKLEISDWINAVQVYANDEVNLMIKKRIDEMITKGRFLKNRKLDLTEADKKSIELAISKEVEAECISVLYQLADEYQDELIKRFEEFKTKWIEEGKKWYENNHKNE